MKCCFTTFLPGILKLARTTILLVASAFTFLPDTTHAQFIQQGTKLVGTGTAGNSNQGYSVSVSSDGNTAIVGGFDDSAGVGAVWVYTRTGGIWSQQGSKLVGTGAIGSANQGIGVAISSDGNTAIVGGFLDDGTIGAAWVFIRTGGVWSQQAKLVGTGPVGGACQGYSVTISADGNTAMMGGVYDNGSTGAAWVFTRAGTVWSQQGSKLVGTGAAGSAEQGYSVCLSSDGNTAIVGGHFDDGLTGAAWVYTRTAGVWSQQGGKLVGTGAVGGARQGESVSLSSDGNTAIIGGLLDGSSRGAAWVYTRTGSVWSQQGSKLVGTGAVGSSLQGFSVSLSSDGNKAIVGGYGDNGNAGAAWVYTRSVGVWGQLGNKLVGTGAAGNASQGGSVSMSSDGNTAIVGGYSDNGNLGAMWVYVPGVPGIFFGSPAVNFGNVEKNDCAYDTIFVKNTGTGTLVIDSVRTSGGEFCVNPDSVATIVPGDSTLYVVCFCPGASGVQNGWAMFYSNADSSPDSIALTGTGVQSTFAVAPDSVNFGTISISAVKTDSVTVTNNGGAPLAIDSARSSNSVFTVSPNGTFSIPGSGGTKKYYITFNPAVIGTQIGSIIWYSNSKSSPDTVSVSGTADSSSAPASPGSFYGSTIGFGTLFAIPFPAIGFGIPIGNVNLWIRCISIRPSDGVIFGVADDIGFPLYTIDANTGVPRFIGNTGLPFSEIEFGPGDVLFGLTSTHSYSINVSTAMPTLINSVPHPFMGLAFDPTTGVCYGAVGSTGSDIYTINLSAGTATIVGNTGLPDLALDLCFDEGGNLFGIIGNPFDGESLISINKITGTGTMGGFVGLFDFVTGLASWVTFGPAIGIKAALTPFSSVAGSPSAEQTYTVGGGELTNDIVVTPPADFEISLTSGSGFTTSPIVLTESGGMVSTTTIYVRMNRATPGSPSGNITHTSTGAAQKNVAVSGMVISAGPSPKFTSLPPDSIAKLDGAGKLIKAAKRKKHLFPNWTNLLEEVVAQGGFAPPAVNGTTESDSAGGEVIGIAFMFRKNPADPLAPKWTQIKQTGKSDTAWARLSAWDFKKGKGKSSSQISKTMRNKAFNHWTSDPTGTPRGFDSTITPGMPGRKQMKKQMTKLDPKKTPNKLFAELVAFKFNIASSQLGNTPPGFGDLIYDADSSLYDEMSLMAISQRADSMMTFWKVVDSTLVGDSTKYAQLYKAVYDANRAFVGVLDTANFENIDTAADPPFIRLRVDGNVELADVPFLKEGSLRPTLIRPASHDTETEEDFEDGDYFEDNEFEGEGTPIAAKLYQNYPNPFNPATTVSFRLAVPSLVSLKVYNVLGQEVATLLNGDEMDEGYQSVKFEISTIASGVYFYRLDVQGIEEAELRTTEVKKMLLIR